MGIKSIIKDTLTLVVITVVLVLLLSAAKVITEPAINKAYNETKLKSYNEVCNGYAEGEDITGDVVGASAGYRASLIGDDSVKRCKNASGEIIGYIVECTSNGYGGPLNLIVGFDKKGNISGVRYLNMPKETPGLGMKTTEKSFLDSFIGHNLNDLSEVDAISGATISSDAFKEAVSLASMFASRAVTMDGGL